MPEHNLSDAEIGALLDYFDAGGPVAEERQQMRLAAAATAQDVKRGRELFFGEARLAGSGGQTYFVEFVVPIRFQDNSVGDTHSAITFGVHFGIGF